MTVNLAETGQKLDRLIYNMSEQNKRAYSVFYDPTPQDVELPQLDENGNLITVKIPNRAMIKKQMWDDFGGAIGQMNKTVYVDAVNGDDNNPGTVDAPLKTIRKAVNAIPVGGFGKIYLANSSVHKVSGIAVINKVIYFRAWNIKGDGSLSVIRKSNWIGFALYKSFLYFPENLRLENPYDPIQPIHWNCMFKFHFTYGLSAVALGNWNSNGLDVIQIRTDVPFFNVEYTKAVITLYNCDIDELGEDLTISRPLSLISLNEGTADTFTASCTISESITL